MQEAIPAPEELKVMHLPLLGGDGSRPQKKSPRPTLNPPQWLCFVQSCSVPTGYVDCHSLWLIHVLKLKSNSSPNSPHTFQTDTKSQAEPGFRVPWSGEPGPAVQRMAPSWKQSPGCPGLDDLHIFPYPHFQIMPFPLEDLCGDAWEK